MAAARTSTRGLSPTDLDGIRESLSGGRRPKVMFTESAGQIAGQVGQVVRLEDPAAGDEFVVVRFGRDELPFSPADLVIPPRGAVAAKTTAPGRAKTTEAATEALEGPELRLTPPPVPAPREETAPPAPAPEAAPRRAARPAKVKPPAALTVTLAYAEGEWTVGANQGTKALARAVAQEHAERLRNQLAEVEAKLAELGGLA
ncbi:MAG: hypothetical protein AUG44_23950 [Actinobacteria bacterium 13_1_20CM_3_71_11]|nr:MAG: hypothetical protein AUG44_23950 [Actinobacteria bacterium 13_1_20CM_3_71_11]